MEILGRHEVGGPVAHGGFSQIKVPRRQGLKGRHVQDGPMSTAYAGSCDIASKLFGCDPAPAKRTIALGGGPLPNDSSRSAGEDHENEQDCSKPGGIPGSDRAPVGGGLGWPIRGAHTEGTPSSLRCRPW